MIRIDRTVAAVYALWIGLAAGFAVSYFSSANGLIDSTNNLIGRDFVNMWAAAKAVAGGAVERIFDNDSYRAFLRELFGVELPPHNWSYPPHILPFLAPLANFPYLGSLIIWSVGGLSFYLWFCSRPNAGRLEIAALALAPVSLVNLITGQNGFFTAAMMWTGLSLLERKPVAAGIAFGLLTIKPQLGLLLPVVLLIDRRWTLIFSATATTAVLLALTALLFGPQVFYDYAVKAVPQQAFVFTRTEGVFVSMMPTAFMNARLAGLDASFAWLVQFPATMFGIVFLIWAWRRATDGVLKAAALVTATFIASPYLFVYDMTVFMPVLVSLWARAKDVTSKLVFGLVWALPVVCVLMGLAGIPASSLVPCLFAFWLAREILNTPQKPGPDVRYS